MSTDGLLKLDEFDRGEQQVVQISIQLNKFSDNSWAHEFRYPNDSVYNIPAPFDPLSWRPSKHRSASYHLDLA